MPYRTSWGNDADSFLRTLCHILDVRAGDDAAHSERVAALAVRVGRALRIVRPEAVIHLYHGALLHDVGKLGVAEAVLTAPRPLTDPERRTMERHPTWGADLLAPVASLAPAASAVRHHHERWDGLGYPAGLAGDAIPEAARIVAACDVFDALTQARPYRPAWTLTAARLYLAEQAGRAFDPAVVDALLALEDL